MALEHRISELDTYLFAKGTHYEIYEKMGAHLAEEDGKAGTYFSVWAPNARSVSVVGDFNNWTDRRIRCSRFSSPEYGISLFRG